MQCLQWTITPGGGLALPQLLQTRRRIVRRPSAGVARAGLRQWGGKMVWKGLDYSPTESDSIKASASSMSSSGYHLSPYNPNLNSTSRLL